MLTSGDYAQFYVCLICARYKMGVQDGGTKWGYKMGVQDGGTRWGVQDGGTKWGYKMGVQNGGTKWGYKMGVQDGGTKWGYKVGGTRWTRTTRKDRHNQECMRREECITLAVAVVTAESPACLELL